MPSLKLVLEDNTRLTTELQAQREYWDGRFGPDRKYPLAPTHLVNQGEVTDENYRLYRGLFSATITEFMQGFLVGGQGTITDVGYGEGDAEGWFEFAIANGHDIFVADFCEEPLRNLEMALNALAEKRQVETLPVTAALNDLASVIQAKYEELAQHKVKKRQILFLARILENDCDIEQTLQSLGELLRLGMKLVIVHPFREDNPNFVSTARPGIEGWQAQPYSRAEILQHLMEGAKQVVEIMEGETFPFYDRNYTICTFHT